MNQRNVGTREEKQFESDGDWTFSDFQWRIGEWMAEVFGAKRRHDKRERTLRFLEEAIELAQAVGLSSDDVQRVSNYVYKRPIGEPEQEVGGVLITLSALCQESDIDLNGAAIKEFVRIDCPAMKVKIFNKQAFKRENGL